MKFNLPDVGADSETLKELEGYLKAELDQMSRNPMKFGHRPSRVQERILCSTSRRRIVVAANRVGKTEGGMRDVLWTARGNHPYRKQKLCSMIWVGSPDYPSYLRFHKPAFDAWCPRDWIVGEFHQTEKYVDIRRIDGGVCRIFFLSFDMPRSKWQGAGVDAIWLDEECPEDLVKECLARIVTTRGWIMLTFTPVSGVGWWFDRYFKPALEGRSNWHAIQAALATFDVENEAEFNVGEPLVPHLTRAQIVEFASEYPDADERAIRVFGAVKGRTGLVYKAYRAQVHRIPRFRLPSHYDLWGAIDPGYHGFAAIVAGFSPNNRVFVAAEYFSQQESTDDRFKALLQKIRELRTREEWGPHPPTVVFFVDTEDPQVVLELNIRAAAAAEADGRRNDPERFPVTVAFASLDQGLKARKAGFLRVQQALAQVRDRKPHEFVHRDVQEDGEPLMYFFDDLYSEWQDEAEYHRESRLLWEIERYSWKKPPKGSTVQPDDADENSAGGAHAMATLRYLTMARLGPPELDDESETGAKAIDPFSKMVDDDFRELERLQMEGYL